MKKYERITSETVEAIQVGDNIVEMFNLPCIVSIIKCNGTTYQLENGTIAVKGDWIVKDKVWKVYSNDEFHHYFK